MCLTVIYRDKQRQEALAKLPEKFVVWKVAETRNGQYYSLSYGSKDGPWRPGRRKAGYSGPARVYLSRKLAGYQSGWHAFRSHKEAATCSGVVVRCLAEKKHILAIGQQWISSDNVTVVLSHLTFPTKCGKRTKS